MSKYAFSTNLGMFKGSTFQNLTITTAAATGLTAPTGVARSLISIETTSACRYRYDGTSPTVTNGHLAGSGTVLAMVGKDNITNFKLIATSAGTATVFVTHEVDFR